MSCQYSTYFHLPLMAVGGPSGRVLLRVQEMAIVSMAKLIIASVRMLRV